MFNILFSYEDIYVGRFSNLHQCTFNHFIEKLHLRTFFLRTTEKNAFLIHINQEYYCRLFRKVRVYIRPLSFIQKSKNVLQELCVCALELIIIEIVLTANASAYILESSRKRNIIKENIYDEGAFLMLLLNAECNFSKKKFLRGTFSNKSSKTDYK